VDTAGAVIHDSGDGPALHVISRSVRNTNYWSPDRVLRQRGSTFQVLGGSFPAGSELRKIDRFDLGAGPEVYVYGNFSAAPGGAPARGIARWDGTQWRALGSTPTPVAINDATMWDEDGAGPRPPALFVTGDFTSIGGVAARHVARWDGQAWSAVGAVGGGLARAGTWITPRQGGGLNELAVVIEGLSLGSELARWDGQWHTSAAPQVYRSGWSSKRLACVDTGAGPDLYLMTGAAVLHRYRDGAWSPVPDAPSSGSPNAPVERHSLLAFQGSLYTGTYDVGVHQYDGQTFMPVYVNRHVDSLVAAGDRILAVSKGWQATLIRPCGICQDSDVNNDGDWGTDADIEAFFACLAGDCCPACDAYAADFNGDGDFGTDQDIEAFFRVLGGGTC
jgi:hypothetical protein